MVYYSIIWYNYVGLYGQWYNYGLMGFNGDYCIGVQWTKKQGC